VQTVIETADYLLDAKRAGLNADERENIARLIAEHPDAGDKIPGTGGARKLRVAGRGKGKSGGYRVITFFSGSDVPVFLLNVFAKGEGRSDAAGTARIGRSPSIASRDVQRGSE